VLHLLPVIADFRDEEAQPFVKWIT